jgi:hypothetical protein
VKEANAKRQLRRMLEKFTPGTVLHFLGDLFHDEAEGARLESDPLIYERCRNAERFLFVAGIGLDAALPRE